MWGSQKIFARSTTSEPSWRVVVPPATSVCLKKKKKPKSGWKDWFLTHVTNPDEWEYTLSKINMIFVSPELSSVRDYVITHSVRSMSVVCVCMYIVCVHVVCSMYVVFCKIDHCIHIHWCIVMGLGHNDPWIESHMWPQQTWGQRSFRDQWPLVQVFGKKGQCIHILWYIFKSNITMIAKVCDRESRRDSWFENRLVFFWGGSLMGMQQWTCTASRVLKQMQSWTLLRCITQTDHPYFSQFTIPSFLLHRLK